jgi:uncharacterized protein
MLKRLLPRQDTFFKLFQSAADKLVLAATEFAMMLQNLDQQQHFVDAIARYEEEADQIAHQSFELLHRTFITPFDRYDIHNLTNTLDDVIDLIHRISQRFPFYHLTSLPDELIQLAKLAEEAAKDLKEAIYRLNNIKNSPDIARFCKEIDNVERKAHQFVLAGENKLFTEETDFKQFYKLKEVYSHTKLVINRCQDVANILKGIVLEYS